MPIEFYAKKIPYFCEPGAMVASETAPTKKRIGIVEKQLLQFRGLPVVPLTKASVLNALRNPASGPTRNEV
jgi:hypothetical protein